MTALDNERTSDDATNALAMSRVFEAAPARLFEAWSSAAALKRWFCPEGMSVPEATIDFRPGGVSDICMRAPDGTDFWSRGHYKEIDAPRRLAFTSGMELGGDLKFIADTLILFEPEGAGTRLRVSQTYDVRDPAFAGVEQGAAEGWRTTLDRLAREVGR